MPACFKLNALLFYGAMCLTWTVFSFQPSHQSNPDLSVSELQQKAIGHARRAEADKATELIEAYLVKTGDLTPDNGTTVNNDALVKNIPASAFSDGPHGLPRTTITMTFAEAVAAMGLGSNDYYAGDLFVVELRLKLTDGRIYGASSATGIISGGFFSSPFKYNALLTCAPLPGDYVVDMHDTYGDGWQGRGILVTIDGVEHYASICDYWGGTADQINCIPVPPNPSGVSATTTITIPQGAQSATWEFLGDDYPSEVLFEVYGPNGNLLYSVEEPAVGLLPIINCL